MDDAAMIDIPDITVREFFGTFASILTITFLMAFFGAMYLIPIVIRKLKKKGRVARDYYKKGIVKIPEQGGLSIILVAMFVLTITPILFDVILNNRPVEVSQVHFYIIYAEMFVILIYAIMGILDDYVDLGQALKIILTFTFSYPLLYAIAQQAEINIVPLGINYTFDFRIPFPFYENGILGTNVFIYLVVPLFIMVTANLVNMHSGFNGLESGLSAMILITLVAKGALYGYSENLIAVAAIAGATLGFWIFNRYPAKLFEGNIGALAIGATIGVAIVTTGFLATGFIILIPHSINFLMYAYWRLMQKMKPGDRRFRKVKFGKIREDGTLEVPNPYTLKWIPPYFMRINEKNTVYIMYAITFVFCVIGFVFPEV